MLELVLGTLLFLPPAAAAATRPLALKTSDGWILSALYRPPAKSKPVAVLIHGVAAGKGEWGLFAAELAGRGFGTLVFDLRGHGDSVIGPRGKQTYTSFQETDFAGAAADVQAALDFLKARGIPLQRIGLIGGSLGANLAARTEKIAWAALLSPGESYMGVTLPESWAGRRVLAAAAPSDGDSFRTCLRLALQPSGPAFLQARKGHGAQLLDDPDFRKKLLEWLSR